MSSRSRSPISRSALVGYCLILACVAVAVLCTATAQGSYYKMVLCGANNGAGSFGIDTNTRSAANPEGIFRYENYCHANAPYPAGNNSFFRIWDNQPNGMAGIGAWGRVWWQAPHAVMIAAAGGYTRMPGAFNDGWRALFWVEGYDGSHNNILVQGTGVDNGSCNGVCWNSTPVFGSHLWPFPGYGSFRTFVFEMHCFRGGGCDRAGENYVDANSFQLILNDVFPSRINLTNTDSGVLAGGWVRGVQNVTWNVSDEGSGMRFDRLRVDGAQRELIDWRGACNLDANGAVGEFARGFDPCPTGGPWGRVHPLNTATLTDGGHTVQVCSQDYGQAVGLSGSGGESCDQRAIKTDNSAPAAPGGLAILTPNPARYLDRFGAHWTLPPDAGSPKVKVHYDIVDAAGKVVVPQKTVAATNPTRLDNIEGPKAPGDYRLRVWLEDEVGFVGQAATVAIPRDATPPAAPQEMSVTSPTVPRSNQGFDVRWRNITDNGSPISAFHYQVVNGAGEVVVAPKRLPGDNPQALTDLDAPRKPGNYVLRVWLSDAEGNVGAPAEAPLSYDCVRSDAPGGQSLSAGVGDTLAPTLMVRQGQGSTVGGSLRSSNGAVGGAALCIYSRVVTDAGLDFVGTAMTSEDGGYRFPVSAGPSRELIARYRNGHRQIQANATILTQIEPTLNLRKKVVRNKRKAIFYGDIPGPHADNVVIVLQVKSGKGWRAFRRYRTRDGGHYEVAYRFTQTRKASVYTMRAQVRRTVGLPYEPGNSREVRLRVKP